MLASAALIDPGQIEVVDGDTIRVGSEVIRLVGFDTPETYRARCPSERELGNKDFPTPAARCWWRARLRASLPARVQRERKERHAVTTADRAES
jgi:endonuclease YncB( thermonuclease family)